MNKFIVKENSYGHRKRLDFIIKQINNYCLINNLDKKDVQILDIGCGSGLLITLPLGELGYNILGIDVDNSSIEFAKKNNVFEKVNFEVNTIENINDKYDIILTCEILEHLENPIEFLNKLGSKLKDNGIVILTTPNGYGWSENEGMLVNYLLRNKLISNTLMKIRGNKRDITLNKDDKHLQRFSYINLLKIFKNSCFEVVKQENGPVFGGPIIERTLARIPGFKVFSNLIGDKVSPRLALVWYFVLKKCK